MDYFYQVAVNYPLRNSVLTYQADSPFEVGDLVHIPLGRRQETGVVLKPDDKISETIKYKKIKSKISDAINLSPIDLELYQWMSNYYQYSLGQLIFDTLPKFLKRPRPLKPIHGKNQPLDFTLTDEQTRAIESISQDLDQGFSKHYIHGITGSGKTSVYLNLFRQITDKGLSCLFLLPEINLTPQFTQVFEHHLGVPLYLYHSALSNSDRYNLYYLLQQDDSPKIILGVRSSVFLPIKKLGLIVVDEEHDQSFKQDDRCPYNGRDVAIKKAQLAQIPVVLGSATPSLENYYQFTTAKNHYYHILKNRPGISVLPKIRIIDERNKSENKDNKLLWPLMNESVDKIKTALDKKEQVLVFINRLGFANYVQCRSCGHQFNCPNCSVTLKYFKQRCELSCNHCEYRISFPECCPACNCLTLEQKGYGTERVLSVLKAIFPQQVIERFDRDEIKNLEQLSNKLEEFHARKIDILVGTQMLSKGHNFKNVNLVLILGIDSQLNFPDFRSNEKVYQLITQVSGRAGRFGSKSEVLIQTLNQDNPIFSFILDHSFSEFYQNELMIREIAFCPPYSRLAMVYFSSRFLERAIRNSSQAMGLLQELTKKFLKVKVYGPKPANIEKKSNQYTWCLMLKSADIKELHDILHNFNQLFIAETGVSLKIDIDPQTLS